MARSDELAKAIIGKLGLDNKDVQGIVIKMSPGEPTYVSLELIARDELESFIGSEMKIYKLTEI